MRKNHLYLLIAGRSFTVSLLSILVILFGFLPQAALAQFAEPQSQIIEVHDVPFLADLHVPTYSWIKTNDSPKAIVVLLHGGCLSGQSYRTLGEQLAAENYLAISTDMRGYGKWYHNKYGSQYDKTFHYQESLKDFKQVIGKLRLAYPGKPVFILGESLGANACFHLSAQNPDLVDGVIAVSAYAKPDWFFHPYMFVHAAQFLANPWSKLNIKPYLKNRLSETRALAQEHLDDPTARNGQSLKELGKSLFFNISGRRQAKDLPETLPMLMIHGDKDKLCAPQPTIRLFDSLSLQDKELVVVPDKGHLLVETSQIDRALFKHICDWIDVHSVK